MQKNLFRMLVLVPALLVAACTTEPSGGTMSPFPGDDERHEMRLSVERSAETDPVGLLSTIAEVDVDSRGNLYVADRQANEIVMFGPDGSIRKRIGAAGEGPGEFQALGFVQIIDGDSVLAFDWNARRLSVFAPESHDLSYVTTIEPAQQRYFYRSISRTGSNDRYVAAFARPYTPMDDADEDHSLVLSVLDLSAGVIVDTLTMLPPSEALVHREDRSLSMSMHPMGRATLYRVAGDRIYTAWTDTLGVDVYDMEGNQIDRIKWHYQSPPVSGEDVTRAVEDWDEEWRRRMMPLLNRAIPERWPAMRQFLVDDHGRIWMSLGRKRWDDHEWAVVCGNGEYIGSMELPARSSLRLVRENRLYVVEEHPEHGPQVVIYEVLF